MPARLENISNNQSSRFGVKPRLIVAHDTEGANFPKSVQDLHILGQWLSGRGIPGVTTTTQASCHVGGDSDGGSIRIVQDSRKAWHAGWVNTFSLGYEQIGKASWSTDTWVDFFHKGLYRFAAQIATWSTAYDIPIRVAANGREKGVIQHRGVSGPGGHYDCGANYPLKYVVVWAALVKARRQSPRNKSRIKELNDRVARFQRKYRPGRVNTQPW